MWNEAEMREIGPVEEETPRKPRPRDPSAGALRREISARSREFAAGVRHQLTRGGTAIYQEGDRSHGNFLEASYRRICARPNWSVRLNKVHTSQRQGVALDLRSDQPRGDGWRELDSAGSSDALLMNLFCYPRVLAGERLPSLLGIERGLEPVFGYHPRLPLVRGLIDKTEVDMRLGDLLVEAKLTEAVFPSAPLRKVERYVDFETVFDPDALVFDGQVRSYQMVRGVLAAHAGDCAFCLLCDARRPEMIAAWGQVALAVRSFDLRSRLKVVTWQEIAGVLPASVQGWLVRKYGIVAGEKR